MDIAIQQWESAALRACLPGHVLQCIESLPDVLAVPSNVAAHVRIDHPKDAPYLNALEQVISAASHFEKDLRHPGKYVLCSRFDEIRFRAVIIRSDAAQEPSILVSLYRRRAAKVLKAI